jgi:hypothetical protein
MPLVVLCTPCMFPFVLLWFIYKDGSRSVELVVKGARGGKVAASCDFSTASAPVRWRLFASELSTNPQTRLSWFAVRQLDDPWGHQARGKAWSVAPFLADNPNGCLGQ